MALLHLETDVAVAGEIAGIATRLYRIWAQTLGISHEIDRSPGAPVDAECDFLLLHFDLKYRAISSSSCSRGNRRAFQMNFVGFDFGKIQDVFQQG